MVELPPQARAGLFGKLPARGDFVRENLPRDFTDAWDAWWQRGLADTQHRPIEEWREAWLEAPVWRFVLPPGLCGAAGVLGLWMPSVDKAGRYSPLTIAATAPVDWAPLVAAMTRFLDDAEEAGRDALSDDLSPAELLERIQGGFSASEATDPSPTLAEGQAAWWTEGAPHVGERLAMGAALPEGRDFAALIDERWAEVEVPAQPVAGATEVP
ncbi:MAG: type VI secretion system-associated protein TagF [Reyranellaceae bacterium]